MKRVCNSGLKTIKIDISDLIQSVSNGDRKAFNIFYDVYYEQVFRFSYYFLKNKDACREVVSDTFFSIWQSRKKLIEISNIEAYLYIVTKNKSNLYLEKISSHKTVSLDEIPMYLEIEHTESPEEEILSQEIDTLLTEVINELPEKCRIIFLMTREEGLKPKEIAEILNIAESTIRVQIKIAIEKIIARIKPHFPDITLTLLISYLFLK